MQFRLELIPEETTRVYLAYSGGLDSSVLLHLLKQHSARFEVIAWHVNHGLLSAASQMQQFCVEQAERYAIRLRLDHLELGDVDGNIEAEARQQRYSLFASGLEKGDCLLTAHHADDQAETFLLNALRGSGSAGLRGIASRRVLGAGLLLRPLLLCSRAQLEDYANRNEIGWFNDPSNQLNRFDRNYLRNQVMPEIAARWPHYPQALTTACRLQGETQALLDEVAEQDFQLLARPASSPRPTLEVDGLLALSAPRCKNLVRYWVNRAGLATIPGVRLDELLRQLSARADAMPHISLPQYSIRLYDRRLHLVLKDELQVCRGNYDFELEPLIEIGECGLRLARADIFNRLQIDDENQRLSIRFRKSLPQCENRHRLKRLFQKHRIPPWQRDSTPQVYLDDELRGLLP